MKKNDIIIYLCNEKIGGQFLTVSELPPGTIDISIEEGTATFDLYLKKSISGDKSECIENSKLLEIPLVSEFDHAVLCLFGDSGSITWEIDVNTARDKLIPYVTLVFSDPDGDCVNCYWWETVVFSKYPYNPSPRYPFLVSTGRKWIVGTPGMVPNPNEQVVEKLDYIQGPASESQQENVTPNLVPGEQISLWWSFKVNGNVETYQIANTFFRSPLFSGGKVIEKTKINNSFYVWDVEIEGKIVSGIVPSDFAEYNIGSWVYLMGTSGSSNLVNRSEKFLSSEILSGYRIVPIDLNGKSSSVEAKGDLKDISFIGDFGDVINYSYMIGVIDEIVDEKANVTVDIPYPTGVVSESFTGVEIFYNCPNYSTTDGYKAFSETDKVILFCENSTGYINADELSVIGFIGNPKLCTGVFLYCVSGIYCFVWDLEKNKYAEDVLLNDNITLVTSWPVRKSLISVWLSDYDTIQNVPVSCSYSQSPKDPVFDSGCSTLTSEWLQYETHWPYNRCKKETRDENCSTEQIENEVHKNVFSVGQKIDYQSSQEDYFLTTQYHEYFYPFGKRSTLSEYGPRVNINTNDPKVLVGEHSLSIESNARWERHTNLTSNEDMIATCASPGWDGIKQESTANYTYIFSNPFSDVPINENFSITNFSKYYTSDYSTYYSEKRSESIIFKTHLNQCGGIVGSLETVPYMVSWYRWKIETTKTIRSCSSIGPECVMALESSDDKVSVDEYKVFLGKVDKDEDPLDLDPLSIPYSSALTDAMLTLGVGGEPPAYAVMKFLY